MFQLAEGTVVCLNEVLKINNKDYNTEQYWFATPEQQQLQVNQQHSHLPKNKYLMSYWNYKT